MGKREFANDCVLHKYVLGKLGAFNENLVDDILNFSFVVDLLRDANVNLDEGSQGKECPLAVDIV